MNKMKIATIVGARPQFVKAAIVSKALRTTENIEEVIIHTGQHFDNNMSEIFFDEMKISRPDYNLNIHSLSHGAMTGQMLEKIEEVLKIENPDLVLLYGDTNSTLAGAIAAKKLNIKIAHVEAGLRSNNIKMPEEINRILTDRISDYLFCPSELAVNNLFKEGFNNFNCKIYLSGDVMYDAYLQHLGRARKPNIELPSTFILASIHRSENTDFSTNLLSIIDAFEEQSRTIQIVMPLHPRTKKKLSDFRFNLGESHIFFIDPVGFHEMIWLLQNCKVVITDSGGLQKEAYFNNKYCITVREETEWIELVNMGVNKLVKPSKAEILESINQIIQLPMFRKENVYGSGYAGEFILDSIYTDWINSTRL